MSMGRVVVGIDVGSDDHTVMCVAIIHPLSGVIEIVDVVTVRRQQSN